jgi:glycosyltransferase involved in cell wall biosynthesis
MSSDSQGKSREGSLLWVFPYCLDHIGHGNIQRVLAIADYLAEQGVAVDLVYQGNPRVPSREREFSHFRRVLRVPAWHSSDEDALLRERSAFFGDLEWPPDNLTPGSALTLLARGLVEAMNYTAVIGTYAWTAPIFEPFAGRVLRISDVQDILHLHGQRSLKATGTTTNFYMNAETEAFLWRKWDVLLAITPEEARVMAPALRPTQTLVTVPHAVKVVTQDDRGGERVLYIGSDNYSNQQAVTWLLREVWPRVRAARPSATLRLAGLICRSIESTPLAATPGIELAGFVEDPDRELAEATLIVAPYLYGSGLKIKVVETAGVSRALVTTSGGIEGTGLLPDRHLLVADDPMAFASAVVRLLDDPRRRTQLAAAAREHVVQTFSGEACYGPILSFIRAARAQRDAAFTPGVIPPLVERRMREAIQAIHGQVVIWGNGSHTRSLMALLAAEGARVRGILDRNAVGGTSQSPEGVPVMPPASYNAGDDDLVLLSSQTFEAEMWEDAAALREAGTHVMALYRREFITEGLKRRLRLGDRERLERAWGTRSTVPATRLTIAEPRAGRNGDDFARLAGWLRTEAATMGVDVLIAGAKVQAGNSMTAEDRELVVPAFEFMSHEVAHEVDDTPWRALSRFASLRALELERLHGRLVLQSQDIVFFTTASLVDVLAAGIWLARVAGAALPAIRLLFRTSVGAEAKTLGAPEQALRHAYAVALAQLSERCEHRLRVFADGEQLAADLTTALQRQVQPVRFPLSGSVEPSEARAALRIVLQP